MQDRAQDDDLVMGLVDRALKLRPDEREAYLRSACRDDTALFEQVWGYVQWEERMQGFLREPLIPAPEEPHFQPGDLLADRFKILREVAQGGMGVVYEAWDEKLERRIAIKCAKPGFHRRLPPEVRSAREISHPNVCRIFDIHTASTSNGEVDFVAMEFVDGETLAERLSRGPMPEKDARKIALQLCAGLSEAHRNQVIHGDLKSRNVMLAAAADGSLRAVITDFGLARRPGADQPAGASTDGFGTPDYMAPELWKGAKATVASDIYALGVLLYELVSGGSRPLAEIGLPGERASPRLPSLDPEWDPILARCLDYDPARRYAHADQIVQALAPARSRRWMLASAAAALVAAVLGTVAYQRAKAPQETVRLAVLPFAAEAESSALARGLFRDTSAQLGRIRGSPRTRLVFVPHDAERRAVDLKTAGAALGATHVLHGRIGGGKEKVAVHAYLTDTRSMVNTREWKAEYPPGETRFIAVALAGMVTGTLHVPALEAVSKVNAAAAPDYNAGLHHLRRNSGADAALDALERAVAADPDSPLTHAALGEAQRLKFASTRDRQWLERAQRSAREAERRNPDLAPVHRIMGLVLQDTGFYEPAAVEYRRAIELEPANGDAFRRLGQVLEQNSQLDEALAAYRKAIELRPEDYRNFLSFGSYFFKRANYGEAVIQFREAVKLAPDDPGAHFALGTAYVDKGDYPAAEAELQSAIGLSGGANTNAQLTLALVLLFQSKNQEAITCLKNLLERWPARYQAWLNLGIALGRVGRAADAEQAYRRGLALAEKEMTRDPRNGKTRSNLAYFCAKLGDARRAESEIAQAMQLSPADADVVWMAAVTYEALGQRRSALAAVSKAPAGVLASLNRWPDVRDLSRDPGFQQLLTMYQLK